MKALQPSQLPIPCNSGLTRLASLLCLGLLLVLAAYLEANPPAIAMMLVGFISAAALASAMLRRVSCGDIQLLERDIPGLEQPHRRHARQPQHLPHRSCSEQDAEAQSNAPRRQQVTYSHRVWTRADGFTMSGHR